MAISQSNVFEPQEEIHYTQMLEEAKLLAFGDLLAKAFFRRIQNTSTSMLKRLRFKVACKSLILSLSSWAPTCCLAFRYNVKDMFVGSVPEGGPIPSSDSGCQVICNASFLVTNLLPHNPARGDGSFIRVTGNDTSTNQYDDSTLAQTLNAFSHFMFAHTGGTNLLVDFQGIHFHTD